MGTNTPHTQYSGKSDTTTNLISSRKVFRGRTGSPRFAAAAALPSSDAGVAHAR